MKVRVRGFSSPGVFKPYPATMPIEPECVIADVPRCTCGKDVVGDGGFHSDWCDILDEMKASNKNGNKASS